MFGSVPDGCAQCPMPPRNNTVNPDCPINTLVACINPCPLTQLNTTGYNATQLCKQLPRQVWIVMEHDNNALGACLDWHAVYDSDSKRVYNVLIVL
jgi:hypothetical protein